MRSGALLCAGLLALVAAGCADQEQTSGATSQAARVAAPASPTPSVRASSPAPTPSPVRVVPRGDGRLSVVAGTSAPSGPGDATRYVVEVEGGLGVDAVAFAREVERTLADPRSWSGQGRRPVRRVSTGRAVFRVALASPATTDRLCRPLDTNGYYSCANGQRAVLNVARWLTGAPTYAGRLPAYRQYLVNHEVGHVLGHGHAACGGRGQLAPVMLQQTKTLAGCRQNPWPYP